MKKNISAILIIATITTFILFLIFKPVILNPNAYLFNKTGETIKGYYNFSYNLKYGKGIMHEGVNFPYGEHIQFDNNQPLLLGASRLINKIIPISDNGVGILNLSMILSILLSIPFIFLILRRSKLPILYASFITVLIVFLSPQLQRFQAQIEMSYLFFIPMIWYFLIRIKESNKKWIWGSLLIISGISGGLVDKYYLAFYFTFLISIILAEIWINRKSFKSVSRNSLIMLLVAVIPVLFVNGIAFFTDTIGDRPINPYGYNIYNANLFSIFLPFEQLFKLMPENIYNMADIKWEGHSYVGFPAMIIAVVFSLNFIYRFYTRRNISEIFPHKELNTFLIGAFLILLFSMFIPGTGLLTKIIPSIKQFRALGRFSWVFYYVFTIYSAVHLYNYYIKLRQEGKQKKAVWIMTIALILWSYDSYSNSISSFKNIVNENDKIDSDNSEYLKRIEKSGIYPENYQALLFLPFANTTGDKLMFERGLNAFSEAVKVSYNTRIPIIESLAPYISFKNALSSVQLLSDPQIYKTRFDDMGDKPILLVCTKEELSKDESFIKDNSQLLWEDDYISLSNLDPQLFREKHKEWKMWADSLKNTLRGEGMIFSDTLLKNIYYKDFNGVASEKTFLGEGALNKKKGKIEVFNENFYSIGLEGEYSISFWIYFDQRVYDMPKATINIIDKYGLAIDIINLNIREESNIYKDWIRIDKTINFEFGLSYQLEVEGKCISIDNLLIQPFGSNVYIKYDSFETMNNFVIE